MLKNLKGNEQVVLSPGWDGLDPAGKDRIGMPLGLVYRMKRKLGGLDPSKPPAGLFQEVAVAAPDLQQITASEASALKLRHHPSKGSAERRGLALVVVIATWAATTIVVCPAIAFDQLRTRRPRRQEMEFAGLATCKSVRMKLRLEEPFRQRASAKGASRSLQFAIRRARVGSRCAVHVRIRPSWRSRLPSHR